MNLTHLERIIFIAKTGSITEAAAKLFISQSALSQMVNSVEEELGATIFDRRSKPMHLTPAGEHYLAMARHVTIAYNSMINEIYSNKSGTTGVIHCGISVRRSQVILPPVLKALAEFFPQVSVQVNATEANTFEAMILRGLLDIAFGSYPSSDPNIGCIKLNDEVFMLAAKSDSPFAARMDEYRFNKGDMSAPISIAEVQNERLIATLRGSSSRNSLDLMLDEVNIRPFVAVEVINFVIALEYAEMGLGLAVLPQTVQNNIPFEYRTEALSFYEIDSKYTRRSLYLLYDKAISYSPPHRFMIDQILENYGYRDAAVPQE